MTTYTFAVEVETDTAEHAAQVMRERIYHDEQYRDEAGIEFDYQVDYYSLPVSIDGEAYQ